MSEPATQSLIVSGTWTKWTKRGNKTTWHWFHKNDPVAYCGAHRPDQRSTQLAEWNPLRPCRKCLDRINREGY